MSTRFRKRIKVAPGVYINISKGGISTSVGKPGATVNFGKDGIKSTVGLPGTGLSYTHNHSKGKRNQKTAEPEQQEKNGHLPGWVSILVIAAAILIFFYIST